MYLVVARAGAKESKSLPFNCSPSKKLLLLLLARLFMVCILCTVSSECMHALHSTGRYNIDATHSEKQQQLSNIAVQRQVIIKYYIVCTKSAILHSFTVILLTDRLDAIRPPPLMQRHPSPSLPRSSIIKYTHFCEQRNAREEREFLSAKRRCRL